MTSYPLACVTGATGLIGRYVVKLLCQQGYAVRILSRKPAVIVQPSPAQEQISYHCGDLCDVSSLDGFLQDAVLLFHCAGEVRDQQRMWQVNVQGTENLLHVAARASALRYLCHISSAGVVGNTSDLLITEETQPCPRMLYESSKWASEQLVRQGLGKSKSVVILRPTVVVDETHPGPMQLAMQNGVAARLKRWIKGGEGAYMVHAEDVARAALFFIDTPFDEPACFFVSCDADPWNTLAGLRTMYHALQCGVTPQLSNCPMHVSLRVPYLWRQLMRRPALRGDKRFSSQKLFDQGFVYHYSVKTMVQRCLDFNESQHALSEILV